jgi:CheY-like chemotaxis protein
MQTILIADDFEANRLVLSKLLTHAGYRVLEAPDGASALEQVRAEQPDLALVDLLMPVVDGFEFVHRLRQEDGPIARTPVIFITAAYLPSEVLPLAESCGVTHVLARPADFDEILRVVKESLSAVPPQVPRTGPREFHLELLALLSRTLSNSLRTVIPSLAEYFEEETRCPDDSTAQGRTERVKGG